MTIQLITPDIGEVLQVGPIRVRVLEDGTATAGRLGLVELTLKAASNGPPQHVHREHDETFFVVSGTVRFRSANDNLNVGPGGYLTAPVGLPHTFGNPDPDQPAVMLCTVTPDRYVNYFRELALATQGGQPLEPAVVLEIMSRYATDPYRPVDA